MASANEPVPPPADAPAIPLPPPKPSLPDGWTPAERGQVAAGLDVFLVALVLLSAFLLGSFVARNSDLWMHLAVGRLLAQGEYTFGTDPFAYTTEGAYWANHSWLYGLLVYAGYVTLGGAALVVIKALLVVAAAWFMIQTRRRGESLWLPAVCTLFALVVANTRLLLQPATVSVLFLAITLFLLQRPRERGSWHLWLLPVLFAAWVNLDAWFVVGLLAVGLWLIGEQVQGFVAGRKAEALGTLTTVAAVSVAACLLSPHHVRVFALPAEISVGGAVGILEQDPDFTWYFASPFSSHFVNRGPGVSLSGLAFYPLVLAGLASFALCGLRQQWERVLLWVGFFALAAWRWQALPFFAVVAGPIMALNFQDFAARLRARRGAAEQAGEAPDALAGSQAWRLITFQWWSALGSRGQAGLILGVAVLAAGVVWLASGQEVPTFFLRSLGLTEPPLPALVFLAAMLALLVGILAVLLGGGGEVAGSWQLGGRCLSVLAVLALLLLVWPGWLNDLRLDASQHRRVGWGIETDPSLERTAQTLRRWRDEGKLSADARGFSPLPQAAGYLAWFCPEEKSFLDFRFNLFSAGTTAAFLEARTAVRGPSNPFAPINEEEQSRLQRAGSSLRRTFRDYGISHVLYSTVSYASAEPVRLWVALQSLAADPREWSVWYVDGRTALIGWREPSEAAWQGPLATIGYDPERLAFGRVADEARAPEAAPRPPLPRTDWARFLAPPLPRPLSSDESELHHLAFEGSRAGLQRRHVFMLRVGCQSALAGDAVGLAAPGGIGPWAAAASLAAFRLQVTEPLYKQRPADAGQQLRPLEAVMYHLANGFMASQDDGSPGASLLAIRAARRALAANPDDAVAWLRLYQGYDLLGRTREKNWMQRMPAVHMVRRLQRVVALRNAVTAREDIAESHRLLADLYARMSFLDLALAHRQEHLKRVREAGPQQGETPVDYQKHLATLEDSLRELETTVKERTNEVDVAAVRQQAREKARLASEAGLPAKALQVLLEAEGKDLTPPDAQLLLELLLMTGRLSEAAEFLDRIGLKGPEQLGYASLSPSHALPAYNWFLVLKAAASGDYREADDELGRLIEQLEPERESLLRGLGGVLLRVPQPKPLVVGVFDLLHWQEFLHGTGRFRVNDRRMADGLRGAGLPLEGVLLYALAQYQQAELILLRGLLLLEQGDVEQAEKHFLAVQARGGAHPVAGRYLELIQAQKK